MEVYIAYIIRNFTLFIAFLAFLRFLSISIIITVHIGPCNHILKTHVIFCQSTSLIGKNMLDLSKLFIKGTCLDIALRGLSGVKFGITNINPLYIFDHFQ